ncbi:siderophore-interacting protein [Corynebacterium sp. 11A]|uniref:siderophore-interacting protein n=1 Tax=Corynebacterium sp. 11A TaxID=2080510 RepID=UPI00124E9D61|nr:siderophore-interacting protein [Corynebacterium sp. 11A]
MGKGIYGTIMKLLRAEDLQCTVERVWMHTDTMKALRISSPEFIRTIRPAEGEYLRCWFPELSNPAKEVMRGYTLTDIDYDTGEFTLYFLLHEPAGPACAWAQSATEGDTFDAAYYGSSPFRVEGADPYGFVFIADAAGIPYVNALAADLAPRCPVQVWMLDWHPTDHEIPIMEHENISVEWVAPTSEALLEKARGFTWEGWYPHLICEAKVLLVTRRYLLKNVGMKKGDMHIHAYWIAGKAMGTSRDVSRSQD